VKTFDRLALALTAAALVSGVAVPPGAAATGTAPASLVIDRGTVDGKHVGLVATLTDEFGAPLAGRKITFLDGAKSKGGGKTAEDGTLAKTVSLGLGTHSLAARFKGDATYAAVESEALDQPVGRAAALSPASGEVVATKRPVLSWTAVNGATLYHVRLAPKGGDPIATTAPGTSVAAPALEPGLAYTWTVWADVPGGTSVVSKARRLTVSHDAGSGWQIETVTGDDWAGSYPDIAVDSANHPHACFLDYTDEQYHHAWWDGTTWTDEPVATAAGPYVTGKRSKIAIDGTDRVHMAFQRPDVAYYYARRDPGGWTAPTAIPMGTADAYAFLGGYDAIAVNPSTGVPHVLAILYGSTQAQDTTMGYWNTGRGSFLAVEGDLYVQSGHDCSVALAPDGTPRIAYLRHDTQAPYTVELRYGTWNGSGFDLETAATDLLSSTSSGNGWESMISLAVDSQGKPHIAYLSSAASYRYAVKSGLAWTVSDVLLDASNSGSYVSLKLDASDAPHIALTDGSGYLRYASLAGASWVTERVDTAGGACALAVDALGGIHIAYHDEIYDRLKYAYLAP
jgi:hypothetical protein